MKLAALALLFFFALSALAARDQLAPLHTAEDAARIEGEYLVLFNEALTRPLFETQAAALQSALEAAGDGSELKRTMTVGDKFRALHLKLSPKTLTAVRSHPSVVLVEENQVVQVNQEECNVQNDVIWNLGRISTHDIDLVDDGYKYSHDGEDVDVYIIDTGILTTHEEFAGRAEFGANFAGGSDADCNGHGTHVAGTVAGELYGVAKKATVIAVKVLDCAGSGSYDGVIQGISWTANEAKKRGRPSAANMSLGGGKSAIVNNAVAAAVDAGVTFVVAAGNENTDACLRSPASEPKAVTVAATTIVTTTSGKTEDRRASFSNFGKCVDIAAPGQLIKAAWIDKAGYAPNTVTNIISGTSMASPHVAGVAALVLSQYPDATPAEVEAAIYSVVTEGAIDLACPSVGSACAGTPNRLLYASC